MSLSAKKRFLAGAPIQDLSDRVIEELIANQWETVGGKVPGVGAKFLLWMARPDEPEPPPSLMLHTIGVETREEWPRIKTSLDMGFPVVLGLILVGPSANLSDVGKNHQVLAIGYSLSGSFVKINVYDPNHVSDTVHRRKPVTIRVNFGSLNPLDASYSEPLGDGKRLRGFFVIDDQPPCLACDCTQWVMSSCIKYRSEPSTVPPGYRYLAESLWKVPPAFSVPISYLVH